MKKTYAILLIISLLAVYQVRAQYVVGPSVVCSGETATYTVYGPGCMVQIDGPEGLNHGTYSAGPGYWNFTINWTNTGTSNVTDNFTIYISAMYWDPNTEDHTGCPPYFAIPLSVTVKPNVTSVARPSTPTVKYISGKLYEFETSSSNATNYQWVVTGGTIQGSSTGKKIGWSAAHLPARLPPKREAMRRGVAEMSIRPIHRHDRILFPNRPSWGSPVIPISILMLRSLMHLFSLLPALNRVR